MPPEDTLGVLSAELRRLTRAPAIAKHTILFLAANPLGTDRLALDEEARAIQDELERSSHRDEFEFVTRWAAQPLDLLRELRKLKPTVVHFSGHGGRREPGERRPRGEPSRDIIGNPGTLACDQRHGLYFQGADGRPQLVSTAALEATFGAAGSSVKLVVLNACYSDVQAEAILAHVRCVVSVGGPLHDDAARAFALGLYGGLGERESVAAAYKQGCAAVSLEGLTCVERPQLKVCDGVDAEQLVLTGMSLDDPTAFQVQHQLQLALRTLRMGLSVWARLTSLLGSLPYIKKNQNPFHSGNASGHVAPAHYMIRCLTSTTFTRRRVVVVGAPGWRGWRLAGARWWWMRSPWVARSGVCLVDADAGPRHLEDHPVMDNAVGRSGGGHRILEDPIPPLNATLLVPDHASGPYINGKYPPYPPALGPL